MKLKKFMMAGAASMLFAGAATAGEIKVEVTNVNSTGFNGVQEDANIEMDTDEGSQSPGALGAVTVEEAGFALSSFRDLSGDKSAPAHFEIDIREVLVPANPFAADPLVFANDNSTFVEISLSGPGEWKAVVSPNALIRDGSDNIESNSATGARTAVGGTDLAFTVDADGDGENALGVVLPINITSCSDEPLVASVTITTANNGNNPFTFPTTDVTLLEACDTTDNFISNVLTPVDLTLDFETDVPFSNFLVPSGDAGKGLERSLHATVGFIDLKVKNRLHSLKAKSDASDDADPENRYIDITDVESYDFTVAFKDTTGIANVGLSNDLLGTGTDSCNQADSFGTLDGNDFVFSVSQETLIDCFGFEEVDPDELLQKGTALINVYSSGIESIKTQDVDIINQQFDMIMNSGFEAIGPDDDLTAMITPVVVFENIEDAFRIVRTGINFGPFDWSTETGSFVNSFYRLSGFPATEERDEHGEVVFGTVEGLTEIGGAVLVDNSSRGVKGVCEFTLEGINADAAAQHEFLFSTAVVADILRGEFGHCAGTAGDMAEFGRADLTFTFFIPESEAGSLDMDRLLFTGGVFASYGDNSNDAFSLKARSCDTGRFGPHVANNLSGDAADVLTLICSLGAIEIDNQ